MKHYHWNENLPEWTDLLLHSGSKVLPYQKKSITGNSASAGTQNKLWLCPLLLRKNIGFKCYAVSRGTGLEEAAEPQVVTKENEPKSPECQHSQAVQDGADHQVLFQRNQALNWNCLAFMKAKVSRRKEIRKIRPEKKLNKNKKTQIRSTKLRVSLVKS